MIPARFFPPGGILELASRTLPASAEAARGSKALVLDSVNQRNNPMRIREGHPTQ